MESNEKEETVRKEMIDMCLLLEKELKKLEKEWRVRKKKNFQFEQQCSELNKQIAIFKGEEADELKSCDVFGMRDCQVELNTLEEDQITQEKLVESVHSIDEHSQTDQLGDDNIQINYKCEYPSCGRTFKRGTSLANHRKINFRTQFQCNENGCGKLFPYNNQLQQHIAFHSSVRPLPCHVKGCDWRAKTKSHLTRHVSYCHSDIKFKCDIENCQKTYKTKYQLKFHQRENHEAQQQSEIRKFACSWIRCEKRFSLSSRLKKHYRIVHLKERPFKCNENGCEKSFPTKNELKRHFKLVHSSDRPFQCQLPSCDRQFKTESHLNRHINRVHLDLREIR